MSSRIESTLRMIGKQIHARRNAGTLKLTAYARTELTWAKIIDSYDNVPEAYKNFFHTHRLKGQTFPYSVLTPAFHTFGYTITEKLVCAFEKEILFLEQGTGKYTAQYYPLENISYVKLSSMLLDSRLEVSGVGKDGITTSSIVRFSSSTDYMITPILDRIRQQFARPKDTASIVGAEAFDPWITSNFKFMNLAIQSIMKGEKVLYATLQPEIRARRFTILGTTFYKTLSPTHACILAEGELILIREEALQDRRDKYGAIREHIPLNKIAGLSLSAQADNLLVLSIRLQTGQQFDILFERSMKKDVDGLLAACSDRVLVPN